MKSTESQKSLLLNKSRKLLMLNSILVLVLTTISCVIGILLPNMIYKSDYVYEAFYPNDLITLLLVCPLMVWSIQLTKKDNDLGILFLMGLLWYLLYIYVIYIVGTKINLLTPLYFAITAIAMYTVIGTFIQFDNEIEINYRNNLPRIYLGWLLTAIGVIFCIRQIIEMVQMELNDEIVGSIMLGQWLSDLLIFSVPLMLTGFLLLRNNDYGYLLAPGMHLSAAISFIGLVPFLIIQSLISSTAIDWFGIIFVTIFGLPLLIPLHRYFSRNQIFIQHD